MSHPFEKLFERALKKSSEEVNEVLKEAEKLKAKGYRAEEIHRVLQKLQKSLIQDEDERIVSEAVEEFSRYLDA